MEQMEKSSAGAKVTWFIIGAVVAALVAWIIVASTSPAGVGGGQREFSGQDVAVYECNGLIQVLILNPDAPVRTTTFLLVHQAQFFSDETSFTNAILGLETSGCSPVVTRLIRE